MPRDEPNLAPVSGTVRYVVHPLAVVGGRATVEIGESTYDVTCVADGAWTWKRRGGRFPYAVMLDPPDCSCPDSVARRRACKHICALVALLTKPVAFTDDLLSLKLWSLECQSS